MKEHEDRYVRSHADFTSLADGGDSLGFTFNVCKGRGAPGILSYSVIVSIHE